MYKIFILIFFTFALSIQASANLKSLTADEKAAVKGSTKVTAVMVDNDGSDLILDISYNQPINVASAKNTHIEIRQGELEFAFNIKNVEKVTKDNKKFRFLIEIVSKIKSKKNLTITATTKARKVKLVKAKNNLKIVTGVIKLLEKGWADSDGVKTFNEAKKLISKYDKKFELTIGAASKLEVDKADIKEDPLSSTYTVKLVSHLNAIQSKSAINVKVNGTPKASKDENYKYTYYYLNVLKGIYEKVLGRTKGASSESDATEVQISYSERILNYKSIEVDLYEVPEKRVDLELGEGIAKYFHVFRVIITNDSDKDLLIYGNTGAIASKTKFYYFDNNDADSKSFLRDSRIEDIDTKEIIKTENQKKTVVGMEWEKDGIFSSRMSGKIIDGDKIFFPIDNRDTLINTFERAINDTAKYRFFKYLTVAGQVSGLFIPLASKGSDFPTGVGIFNASIPFVEEIFDKSDDVQKQHFLYHSLNKYEEMKVGESIDKYVYVNKYPLQALSQKVGKEGVLYFSSPIFESVSNVNDKKTGITTKVFKTIIHFKAAELSPIKEKSITVETLP